MPLIYDVNLHCHSLLSDGVLLPSELAIRYQAVGFKTIAITDHVDYSNYRQVIASILEFCRHWPMKLIKVLPGIELTHLPLEQFSLLSDAARKLGVKVIVAHGETPVEPVLKGTNQAALLSDIDILAHPGMISDEDVLLAKKRGIFLEVSCRKGHCLRNQHVIQKALGFGAKLIVNTDSHSPADIIKPEAMMQAAIESGIPQTQLSIIKHSVDEFVSRF